MNPDLLRLRNEYRTTLPIAMNPSEELGQVSPY
jgi:hypothetical protein